MINDYLRRVIRSSEGQSSTDNLTITSAPVPQISFTVLFRAAAELSWDNVKAHKTMVCFDSDIRSDAIDLSTLDQKSLWVTVQLPVAIS